MKNNIGRILPIKQSFVEHFLKGIDEIIPVNDEMQNWLNRDRSLRAVICADRMVDDVEKLLKKYHDTAKGSENGINAPLPIVLIAFAKDAQPISADRNRALPNPQYAQLVENGEWYQMRSDFVEQRVQIAFLSHTSSTAKSMTSQMRLYFSRFNQYRFPIKWHFGGYDFVLSGCLNEIPVSDDLADLPERTNLTILTWTLTLEVQIPYLTAPMPHTFTADGKIKGYAVIESVDLTTQPKKGI